MAAAAMVLSDACGWRARQRRPVTALAIACKETGSFRRWVFPSGREAGRRASDRGCRARLSLACPQRRCSGIRRDGRHLGMPPRCFTLGEMHSPRGEGAPQQSCSMKSAPRSPTMIAGALVFPEGSRGMIEQSATRRPETPRTRNRGSTTEFSSPPMRHVPTGW